MNFLERIFTQLSQSAGRVVLREARQTGPAGVTGGELLEMVRRARGFLRRAGLKKGDRCALLAHNSIRWTAADLALMAEGVIVVPLYARQAPAELVGMMKDCAPSLIVCGDEDLRAAIAGLWAEAPPAALFDEVFAGQPAEDVGDAPLPLDDADPVTIIYTSGTSGEPKGVVLNAGNVSFMVPCTGARLNQLMGDHAGEERVFHYLPFCFAGSWMLMLTALSRHSVLTMSMDLNRLIDELGEAAPEYFLNVPVLLERVRVGVEEGIAKKGGLAAALYRKGKAAWFRRHEGGGGGLDLLWIALAESIVFPKIKQRIGPNLRALICGSAPLVKETQLFFKMVGIPVLQVYGLTETTAICTMDHPQQFTPGRVGPAIPGIEMRLGENDEILVRGPNIFPGYWNRPEATAAVLAGGWFHTGDQGEVDGAGNWAIVGRIKNLIIPASGHNVAPEPIEEKILQRLPGAQQVVLVGNGRAHLAALITGEVESAAVDAALEAVNQGLPHYKRVRAYHISREPFSIENGLLTANGKLKRDQIAARYRQQIDNMYAAKKA